MSIAFLVAVIFGAPTVMLVGLVVRWLLGFDDELAPVAPAPSIHVTGWYHLELQGRAGHLFGLVDEVTLACSPFLRVREPDHRGGFELDRLLTPKAVYRMTPATEDRCRSEAWGRWYARPMGETERVREGEEPRSRDVVVLRRVGEAEPDDDTVTIDDERRAALPEGEVARAESGERPTVADTVRMKSDRPTTVGTGTEVQRGG